MDCLPDANLVYIFPLLKQLYDSLLGIDKCSTTNVLQVRTYVVEFQRVSCAKSRQFTACMYMCAHFSL